MIQLATVLVFTICVAGGKQKRQEGWKLLCGLLALAALAKLVGVVVIAEMGMHEERFRDGWYVGRSWALAVAATAVEGVIALGLWGSRYFLEEEGGYELIPDVPRHRRSR